MTSPGTATTKMSAPVASPPSRPRAVTSWPAACHRRASPPPTRPRPMIVMRIAASCWALKLRIPRVTDDDFDHDSNLATSEYVVLMHLSEAPDHQLRMSDVAA